MMSDGASEKAPAGAAVERCDSHSSILPYTTNDVAAGDQSCLSTTGMRLLEYFQFILLFSLSDCLQHLQSVWIRGSAEETASKWGMLGLYLLLVSLLIACKWCVSEECVIYAPGVGEGHDDLDQVHFGKMADANEVHSLFKWDPLLRVTSEQTHRKTRSQCEATNCHFRWHLICQRAFSWGLKYTVEILLMLLLVAQKRKAILQCIITTGKKPTW